MKFMSEMIHEIEMEYNGFKLKLKGERDFIDEKIGNMNELLAKILSTPKIVSIENNDANANNTSNTSNANLISGTIELNESVMEKPTESIREFLNRIMFSNDTDTVIGIGYYLEENSIMEDFSVKNIEEYMRKAKYTIPQNISQRLGNNVAKGNIQESLNTTKKLKRYCLTGTGIKFVENYVAKDAGEKSKPSKARKSKAKTPSNYETLTREELCIDNYPKVKDLKTFKEKMILAMYIITSEKKGEYFSVNDLVYILSDLFGERATIKQVDGVFRRETDWFNKKPDEDNRKNVKFKCLNKANAFAEKVISDNNV